MVFLSLTKSKNAVLIHCSDGALYVTSVSWLRMLLDGKARGDMIMCTELSKAKSNGLGERSGDKKGSGVTVDLDVFGKGE